MILEAWDIHEPPMWHNVLQKVRPRKMRRKYYFSTRRGCVMLHPIPMQEKAVGTFGTWESLMPASRLGLMRRVENADTTLPHLEVILCRDIDKLALKYTKTNAKSA